MSYQTFEYANPEEWLALRQRGIGGSDAAAILGLNPYKTPVDVFLEKTGRGKTQEDNQYLEWGRRLESVVAEAFAEDTCFMVAPVHGVLQSIAYPYMLATLDRAGTDNTGKSFVLECKTTSAHKKEEWDRGEVPAAYLVQLMHYLTVTGFDYGMIAVLIGGNDFRYARIDRDADIEATLIEKERLFWNYVERREVPPVDTYSASDLRALYPRATKSEITLPSAFQAALVRREEIREQMDAMDIELTGLENAMKQALGEHEIGRCGQAMISWKNITSSKFNQKRFQLEHPDLFTAYQEPAVSRRFAVSFAKEK